MWPCLLQVVGRQSGVVAGFLVTGGPLPPHHTPPLPPCPLLYKYSWLSASPPSFLRYITKGLQMVRSRGVCHANLLGSHPPSPSPPPSAGYGLHGSYFGPEGGRMLRVPGWASWVLESHVLHESGLTACPTPFSFQGY